MINEVMKHFKDDCKIRFIEKMNICGMTHYEIRKTGTVKEFAQNEFDINSWYFVSSYEATEDGFDIFIEY